MIVFVALACFLSQTDDLSGLLRQLDDDDLALREAASAAIHRMGARVIPDLERALDNPSPEVRGRVVDLLERLPDYALRSILKSSGYPAVRRRWNAVIEAVIWKRPIPVEVWNDLEGGCGFCRRWPVNRPHSSSEILAQLEAKAAQALRRLVWRVGVEGMDPELRGGGLAPLIEPHDFLPLVLRTEPDEVSFEEVYGTLLSLQLHATVPDWYGWYPEDVQTAIRILVQIRRRADLPPLTPPPTREAAMKLACRGPIVRGIADALGRAYSNRGRGAPERVADLLWREQDHEGKPSSVREVYEFLIRLDRDIGHQYYRVELLRPGRSKVPERMAPVPERHHDVFQRVKLLETDDGTERVVRDILENLGETGWRGNEQDAAAILLRAIGARVAEAAK